MEARRSAQTLMLVVLVFTAVSLTACASSKQTTRAPLTPRPEPAIPALTAPPMRLVAEQLRMARAGTGVAVPPQLHLGSRVRLFRLKAHASGARVQDLIDQTRVALVYPVLSAKGLEAEFIYEPWNPTSFENGGFGDFGGTRPATVGQAAEYRGYIAALPSIGASPVVGLLAIGTDYSVSVAWTATGAVGVFRRSGLNGGAVPGQKPPPCVPTGIAYRNNDLAARILSAVRK